MLNFSINKLAAACALSVISLGASAVTVNIATLEPGSGPTGYGNVENLMVGGTPVSQSVIGGFHILLSDYTPSSFYAFCVDVFNSQPLNNPFTLTSFGATTQDRLARVFQAAAFNSTTGISAPGGNSLTNFIGLQMAVWNAVYDTDWSATGGTGFYMVSDTNAAASVANGFLTAAQAIAVPTVQVAMLDSALSQDIVITVPEPSAYLMGLLAIAGLGAVSRRKTKST